MHRLVLIRHGESVWNKQNRFTGWTDDDLTSRGRKEAHEAAKRLKEAGYEFDIVFTSVLRRAIRTAWIILDDLDAMWLPLMKSWRLNERHYGALQGLDRDETVEKYGEEQVMRWRRRFDEPPPAITREDERFVEDDPRYRYLEGDVPRKESLRNTLERLLPYWHGEIAPAMKNDRRVLIVSHANTLRALVKQLDGISDEHIVDVTIPAAIPLVYELDNSFHPLRHFYLADDDTIDKALKAAEEKALPV